VAFLAVVGGLSGAMAAVSVEAIATPETVAPEDLADPGGAFVEVDGARIYYVARGPEDGPAVLLLHGLLGSTLTWNATIDALAAAGFRAVAFDQPPFGLSDKSPDLDYSVSAQADRTIGVMDALGIERAVLVGHSAGGPLAGTIAERYPDRVAKLVFVAPAYLGLLLTADSATASPAPSAAATAEGSPRPGRQPSLGLFPVLFDPTNDPHDPADQARMRDAIAAERARQAEETPAAPAGQDPFRFIQIPGWEAGLLAYGRVWLNDPAILGPAPEALTMPVFLIWGEHDRSAISEQMRALLPDAAWAIIPKVGHFPMEEAPAAFSRELLAFLES
jgi:pimeloyl-ACP methyl ester carboxylesterase